MLVTPYLFIVIIYLLPDTSEGIVHMTGFTSSEIFPYQALFRKKAYAFTERSTQYFCGGAIISNRFILTAAHCTIKPRLLQSDQLHISVGQNNFQSKSKHMLTAEKIIRHAAFDIAQEYLKYDIALIKTNEEIVFDAYIQPIALDKYWVSSGEKLSMCGFGRDDVKY